MSEDIRRYVDLETALSRVNGKTAMYKRLLQLFLKSGEFASLEESLTQQDYPRAAEVAHAIKGMTGNLALNLLFETSAKLMAELKEGVLDETSVDSYRQALTKTRSCVETLMDQLE
jgi:HPt (histidine-containing phosphotransfer) domain-containing protein